MGTWTRNFLVPKADPDALRNTLVRWLERKGFDRVERTFVFADASDDERAAFLVSNAQWSVILYQEAFAEGDRLLTELNGLPVVLETAIADSDVWYYELIEQGELTAAFCSDPHYFGGNDLKLSKNGDPKRLCLALGMEGREAEIRRLQRKRSFFADFPCQAFCRLIGASAGGLTFGDFEGWNNGRQGVQNVGIWCIEPLYFERRHQFGEEARPLILHSFAVREFETNPPRHPALDPEVAEHFRKLAQLIGLVLKPVQWLFWVFGPILRWGFRRQIRKTVEGKTGDPLIDAMASSQQKPVGRDGEWLVNRQYGCRIKTAEKPPSSSTDPLLLILKMPNEVFTFSARGVAVTAIAIRPEKVGPFFTLRNETTLVVDESFFAGPHPARYLALRVPEEKRTQFRQHWFVELEHLILHFHVSTEHPFSPEAMDAIKAVVQSVEQIPTA